MGAKIGVGNGVRRIVRYLQKREASMKIAVMGSGYVGSVTGTCLAEYSHDVSLCDVDQAKVEKINQGISPIYEPGLEKLLKKNIEMGKLKASTKIEEEVVSADAVMICVGTPSQKNGETDLGYVMSAAKDIAKAIRLREDYLLVIIKSTVPPTTTNQISEAIEKESGKKEGVGFGTVMNPEFLREGKAIFDFKNPDRIIMGVRRKSDERIMRQIYAGIRCPILVCDPSTAEMIKYASNSMLATKISFSNEIANVCKKLGLETFQVMEGIGLDKRIGKQFLNPGIGFGGSCFPKDVSSLVHNMKKTSVEPRLLSAVLEVNEKQPKKFIESVENKLGRLPKKAAVLGLAFKPDTDDIRESPAVKIIDECMKRGVGIKAYDPKAMANAKKLFAKKIEYGKGLSDTLEFSDVVFVLTDWEEFKNIKLYKNKIVFEGRRIFEETPENFEGICW